MNEKRLICTSVRLADEEYKSIQTLAKKEYTTISGILREFMEESERQWDTRWHF